MAQHQRTEEEQFLRDEAATVIVLWREAYRKGISTDASMYEFGKVLLEETNTDDYSGQDRAQYMRIGLAIMKKHLPRMKESEL